MNHQVQVLEIDRGAEPTARARPTTTFSVDSDTREEVRRAALAHLAANGKTVRSLSFLAAGGMVAVVTQPAPGPSPAQRARARRGL
jgi:hypothetical protein